MRVALYEDDADVREALCSLLEKMGHVALDGLAEDATDDWLDAHVALVDMHLGKINGIDVIKVLTRFRPECRVVAMSGSFEYPYSAGLCRLAKLAGALFCTPKPGSRVEMEILLRRAVAGIEPIA